MILTDEDILARLTAIEDATVERKSVSDFRGWIKSAVAFSNSLESEQPGVLFVGVNDNGSIQKHSNDFEGLLKKVTGEISNIYPPISPTILVREKDGQKFIAVIVYGSRDTPHFAGKSYVRKGTESIEASEEQFEELIANRTGKVRQILKWKGMEISVQSEKEVPARKYIVNSCNPYWVTLDVTKGITNNKRSYPLRQIELSYDNYNERLMLIID